MENKRLRLIIMFSKYALLGLVTQFFAYTFLLATDGSAQKNLSVHEVTINLNLQEAGLEEIFEAIENKTNYNFLYDKKLLKNTSNVSINHQKATVGEILMDISKSLDLKFKQINETINVRKKEKSDSDQAQVIVIQTVTVTGLVTTDEDGSALPGVNVMVKGTATGTVTDVDGNYSLEVPGAETLLVFSSVGYVTEEVTVGSKAVIDMVLVPDITALEEIIVVGYGTQKNHTVSVAVSQVDSEELEITKRPVTNVQQSLIGSMPGLIINQTRGEPGASVDIRVRETSALSNKNAMVLIDGFNGSLSDVSPNDIATVTVLKDAAATAIYGARGANGVVLVTTKNTRRNEKLSLSYSFNHSRQQPAATPEISNSLDFMEFSNEATLAETLRNNPGTDPATVSLPFTNEEIDRARSGFYPETQWVDKMYGENAGQTSHNININGGSEKTGYLINLGSLNQNGLVVGSDNLKRYNLRMKIDTDITDWLTLGTNASITNRKIENVPVAEGYAVRGRPFFPVQLEDGTFVNKGAAGLDNPVGNAQSGSYDKTNRDALNLQLYGQIKPIKGLVIEERVSITRSNSFREIWETPYEIAVLDMELNQVGDNIPAPAGDRRLLMRSNRQYTLNTLTTAKYNLLFNDQHNINVLVGLQTQDGESVQVEAERLNFILPTLQDLKLGQEISGLGNSSEHGGNRTTMSYFGRAGYDFNGRYLAEVNFRADASSNFGPNNKWGFFPAVSLGWNMKDESFMKQLDFIEIFKLRASWGQNGDDGSINVIENAPFEPTGASLGGVAIPTLRLGNSLNPDLKWETSEKINLGIDLDIFQGKFGMSVEYFVDDRKDIITVQQTSFEGGLIYTDNNGNEFHGLLDNVYDAKSWGWEFDLSHKNSIGEFSYFATANLTYYNSEITNTEGISPLDNGTESYKDIGLPIRGNWYGFEVDGFFDDQEEMDAYVDQNGDPIDQSAVASGDAYGRYLGGFKYRDQVTVDTDNDGVPDAKDGIITADDRVVLRTNAGDNFRAGFNLGTSYKGFSLSARFYGVLKGLQWWRSGQVTKPFTGDVASYVYQTDTWRPDNQDAMFPQATASNILPYESNVDYFIHDNSYIKLKNINLGYSFDMNLIEKLKFINGLDVYVSVENLGTIWTNSPSYDFGWDPELGTGNFRYPLPLTMSFGVNVNF